GTGQRGPSLGTGTSARETALASPWDLEIAGQALFFANAGTHQLGALDLARGIVRRLAGIGHEAIADGPADDARLAQPSGLALDAAGQRLYFADSETSAVRVLILGDAPRIETLVGTGLFDFGHVNGDFATARLQHPLGLAWQPDGGQVLVADSYNGRIRALDPGARRASDADEGVECADPVCLPAGEPAGIAVAGPDRALVVDTNNHRVVEYDFAARRYRSWAA
ncbi:MAG: hypothetical protein HY057_02280, partial [Rhodospirillales bacterium]|nr:hypothetical protein [Rhodospirillales bacterium]